MARALHGPDSLLPVTRNDPSDRCILWRRLDLPGFESARLWAQGPEPRIHGTAVFLEGELPCRLDYRVVCDPQWRTRSATVSGWMGNEAVEIELLAGSGSWRLNGVEQAAVAGCLDVDLSFSPSTNLLPIRRLSLAVGQEAPVRAAWLRFPELVLETLEQTYRRLDDRTYRYESGGGTFMAELEVDELGLVTRYPGLWEAEARL